MKRTVLYDIHKDAGAVFGEYNNYILPSIYPSSENKFYSCTIEDCSYISTFIIKGKDANKIVNNTFYYIGESVKQGHLKSVWFTGNSNEKITGITLFRLEESIYAITLNNIYHELIIQYIIGLNYHQYKIVDYKDKIIKVSLSGDNGEEILKRLYGSELFLNFPKGHLKGDFQHRGVLIARTSLFELYFPVNDAIAIWTMLLQKGDDLGIRASGYIK